MLIGIGAEGHIFAQGSPDHLFKDDEPNRIQVNVFISDDRDNHDTIAVNFPIEIKSYLKQALPSVDFVFVDKMSQMQRTGDNINVIISVKKSGLETIDAHQTAITKYKTTIYDVSKTPIFIKDGNVMFDERVKENISETDLLIKTVNVTNQRLVAFLKRSITHKSFHR